MGVCLNPIVEGSVVWLGLSEPSTCRGKILSNHTVGRLFFMDRPPAIVDSVTRKKGILWPSSSVALTGLS